MTEIFTPQQKSDAGYPKAMLLIGDGFALTIEAGFQLEAQAQSDSSTTWTNTNKN